MISNGIQPRVSAPSNQAICLRKEEPRLFLQGSAPRSTTSSENPRISTEKRVQVYQEPQREENPEGKALAQLLKNKFFIHEPMIIRGRKTWIVDNNGSYYGMYHSLTEIMQLITIGAQNEICK